MGGGGRLAKREFHRHKRDLPTAGLVPAVLLVAYVIIRLIGS